MSFMLVSLTMLIFWALTKGNDVNTSNAVIHRKGKFFPFYTIVRFENSICLGNCKLTGTCYTRKECETYGGTASGLCARGLGVCCVVQKSCGDTSHLNNTYFQNPSFPSAYPGGSRCTISISRCEPNICQLRLDFLDFDLALPDGNGVCVSDNLIISGGASRPPRLICGSNTGQHVYVDFDGDTPIQLSIKTNAAVSRLRRWNIKATQIACDAPERAPSGCLMYYTSASGKVTSFNFAREENTRPDGTPGTRELASVTYGVCVAMDPNFCGIEWSQSGGKYSFTVSGDTAGLDIGGSLGTEAAELRGDDCPNDFVVIPNPYYPDGTAVGTDRFCGNGFITKRSNSKPFVLNVVTNADELNGGAAPDLGNRGFSLSYSQVICSDE